MTKTMSIRMDRDNYEFLNEIRKEQRSDLSKGVRDLVSRGRVLLAVERYRNGAQLQAHSRQSRRVHPSQTEIAGPKRMSQHLSGPARIGAFTGEIPNQLSYAPTTQE